MVPNVPGSYAILLFTVMDFISITSHIHSWVLFLLWLCLFVLSGVSSPLICSSILDTYLPGEFKKIVSYLFAFLYHSWGSQGKNAEVVCHSLLFSDHILSELSTMTCLSVVALYAMAHSFIELEILS